MLLEYLKTGSSCDANSSDVNLELQDAKKMSEKKVEKENEKRSVEEFISTAALLAQSALLNKREEVALQADLFINIGPMQNGPKKLTEITFAVKLHEKAKPVVILQPKLFFQSLIQEEALFLGATFTILSFHSFGEGVFPLLETLYHSMEFLDRSDKASKAAYISQETVEYLLIAAAHQKGRIHLFSDSFEKPYIIHSEPVSLEFYVSVMNEPSEVVLVQAKVLLPQESVSLRNVRLLRSSSVACLKDRDLFLFSRDLHPKAREELESIDTIVIPPSLFGSFFSYSLLELKKIGSVRMSEEAEKIAQKPFERITPRIHLHLDLIDSTLIAQVQFQYNETVFPESRACKKWCDVGWNQEKESFLARDVAQEVRLVQKMLFGFSFDEKEKCYFTPSERKISDFFIETLSPQLKSLELHLGLGIGSYVSLEPFHLFIDIDLLQGSKARCTMKVKGSLKGVSLAKVLEAGRLKKSAIEVELDTRVSSWSSRYILLDSYVIDLLCQCLEELSPPCIDDCTWDIPLWVVLGLDSNVYESAGFTITFPSVIQDIKKALLNPLQGIKGDIHLDSSCTVKGYQKEGVYWLRQLRAYFLGGILADDMGLGKTLQTIGLLSDLHIHEKVALPSLIICPTSLVDNWIMEIRKFQPNILAITLSGNSMDRKKLVEAKDSQHIFIASYGLVQKDIEFLSQMRFSYVILDEGQVIKNKDTHTARAVKQLQADHRLVLTGTPIENSLDDLWSLFDFLMPSFLGSYERFCKRYIKANEEEKSVSLEHLKKKVAPFILRRMKNDVLHDLPAITHTVLHCSLTENQADLYSSITLRAKEELEKLVDKDGFEKSKLHVLATLTRLKQICCHPLLIQEEAADSAKYEMLFELVEKLLSAKKKAVIFSQYAKMLGLIKQDFDKKGIASVVLDGSTKNRLGVVQKFNENEDISFFLVSLRAGGNGLNLVGADTVIHYDLWWNPAVENQATDRVWRMGQKEHVQSYKLITKGTIEEKIIKLQEQKKDIITNLIDSDEDVLSKLSWGDVLELLGG
jgi:hypothetical protein